MRVSLNLLTLAMLAGLLAGFAPGPAAATTYHYCSPCVLAWATEKEGSVRHSYTQNYGHVVSAGSGWVGVRAHDVDHNSYGLNAQGWSESTHSYSGANLLFMIVNNILDDGVGNYAQVSDNAHGTY
ncbi:MAG: hypothetical protein QM648_01725 [Solirubrobacterales bacterium]